MQASDSAKAIRPLSGEPVIRRQSHADNSAVTTMLACCNTAIASKACVPNRRWLTPSSQG